MQVTLIYAATGASVMFSDVTNFREQVVGGVNVYTITWAGQTIRIPTAGFSTIVTTYTDATTRSAPREDLRDLDPAEER